MNDQEHPRVAVVSDWVLLGGAERVVEQLMLMYPSAVLYTSCISPLWKQKFAGRKIVTGYLNWFPFNKVRKFVPFLRSRWFESLNFKNYDLVVSVSAAEAKGVKVPLHIPHINYCNAPTHYYWSRYEDYIKQPGFGALDPLARFGLKHLLKGRRKWDLSAAKRPQFMVANSSHIAAEVKKYYHRTTPVIHPPVDTSRFAKTKSNPRAGFVISGRQTPYKRFDFAISAANALGENLTVLGDGPDHARLVAMAGPTVKFVTNVSDAEIVKAFQSAAALLFPGVDDFGITPVEAMAAGCPVIAYRGGGALDYVVQAKTGLFFDKPTAESLAEAMQKSRNILWDEKVITKKAHEFSPEQFRQQMSDFISNFL